MTLGWLTPQQRARIERLAADVAEWNNGGPGSDPATLDEVVGALRSAYTPGESALEESCG